MSLFNIEPVFVPDKGILEKKLEEHKNFFEDAVHSEIVKIERINRGQGINYKIYCVGKQKPQFLLKILSIKGYPDIEQLTSCYTLLDKVKVSHPEIVYYDSSNSFSPYGFILQRWIDGIDAAEKYEKLPNHYGWVEDHVTIFKKIHAIKFKRYGALNAKLNFASITEYYANIYAVVANSFGTILKGTYSIHDLENSRIISKGFLDETLEKIINLVSLLNYNAAPVLVYGDMLPTNLIYTSDNNKILIDWDEARASWPIYEVARCLYYVKSPGILAKFVESYSDETMSSAVVNIGIRLEHSRQLLRQLFMLGFSDSPKADLKKLSLSFENKILNLIDLSKPLKYWA